MGSQKKITDFFSLIPQVVSEEWKQKVRSKLLGIVRKEQLITPKNLCPLCKTELLEIPLDRVQSLCKTDPYHYKFRFLGICVACEKIIVTPKLFRDLWVEICDEIEKLALIQRKQRDEIEAEKRGIKCTYFPCRKLVNPAHYKLIDLSFIGNSVILQCYHCGRLITIPTKTWNSKSK
jgi:hypothetical protein